jgi:hypothetical protein
MKKIFITLFLISSVSVSCAMEPDQELSTPSSSDEEPLVLGKLLHHKKLLLGGLQTYEMPSIITPTIEKLLKIKEEGQSQIVKEWQNTSREIHVTARLSCWKAQAHAAAYTNIIIQTHYINHPKLNSYLSGDNWNSLDRTCDNAWRNVKNALANEELVLEYFPKK